MFNGQTHSLRLLQAAPVIQPVPKPIPGGSAYAHILIPTSLTARERAAVLLGLQLAAANGAKVTFLRVLPQETAPESLQGLDALGHLHSAVFRLNENLPASHGQEVIESARAEIMTFLTREIPEDMWQHVDVRTECRQGNVPREIARFADRATVDLVVLSSEMSVWGVPVLPSQIRRVLRLTRKPVVVVRPDSPRRIASPVNGDKFIRHRFSSR